MDNKYYTYKGNKYVVLTEIQSKAHDGLWHPHVLYARCCENIENMIFSRLKSDFEEKFQPVAVDESQVSESWINYDLMKLYKNFESDREMLLDEKYGDMNKKAQDMVDKAISISKESHATPDLFDKGYIDMADIRAIAGGNPDDMIVSGRVRFDPKIDFVDIANRFVKWSLDTFTESTAKSCLIHLDREIDELIEELDSCKTSNEDACEEYVDCIGVLISSAARRNITPIQLLEVFAKKTQININRKWNYNGDGTYSHIK